MDTLGCEGTSGGITVAKIVSRVLGSLQPGEIVLVPGWPLTEPPAATGC